MSQDDSHNDFDPEDLGLVMKMSGSHEESSRTSLYHPVPLTPTEDSGRSLEKVIESNSFHRNQSYGHLPASNRVEAKVLVIFTGGTIGMMRNERNGEFFALKFYFGEKALIHGMQSLEFNLIA